MQVIVKILAGSHGVIVLPTIAIWCHLASSSIWLKGQCVKARTTTTLARHKNQWQLSTQRDKKQKRRNPDRQPCEMLNAKC